MRTIRAVRVEADSAQKIREDHDALVVPAILTRESILPFADGMGYRPAAELEAAAWTLEGAWVVAYDHILTVFPVSREGIRGRVENVKFDAKIQGVRGDIRFVKRFCDQSLLEGVRKGSLKDVSVAYFSEDDFTPGKFGDEPYDFVQRNFMFGHVAAGVPEGRCPSPFCGMNVDSFKPHKDPEETENFVHIPVKDKSLFVDGSSRTITLSEDDGVKAVVGKLKSDPEGSTVIQKYLFDKAKDWSVEKAEVWVKEHKDSALPSTSEGSDVRGDAMSPAEIDAKIAELHEKRDKVQKQLDEIYAKYWKQDLKLQNKINNMHEELQKEINALYAEVPVAGEDPKVKALWIELENINGEIAAFREAKVKAEIGSGAASDSPGNGQGDVVDQALAIGLDPNEVLARSRRLLSSR